MISPFSARHVACPTCCMPVSADPLNVQSGAKVRGAWPPTSTDTTAAVSAVMTNAASFRDVLAIAAPCFSVIENYCFGRAKAMYPYGPTGAAGALPVPPPSAPPTSPGPVGGDMNRTYCLPPDSYMVGMPID